jgi:plastocyanin
VKVWICGAAVLLLVGCSGAKPVGRELASGSSGVKPADSYAEEKAGGSGATEVGASQPGPSQPGPSQPGPSQPGPSQPGPSQPGPSQPGPSQPGPSQPEPAPPVQEVQRLTVVMKEFAFEPKVITLKRGVPVELTLVNEGARRHDFSIVGEWSLESDVIASGEKQVLRFTPERAGRFRLVCSQVGHAANGMVAEVVVTD